MLIRRLIWRIVLEQAGHPCVGLRPPSETRMGRRDRVGDSERPANDPNETRRGCFLPDLTRVDKAPVRRRPLDRYLMGRGLSGKAVAGLSPRQTICPRRVRPLRLLNIPPFPRSPAIVQRRRADADGLVQPIHDECHVNL
jgi:hypothetical protein